jgi:hypothetical protein
LFCDDAASDDAYRSLTIGTAMRTFLTCLVASMMLLALPASAQQAPHPAIDFYLG